MGSAYSDSVRLEQRPLTFLENERAAKIVKDVILNNYDLNKIGNEFLKEEIETQSNSDEISFWFPFKSPYLKRNVLDLLFESFCESRKYDFGLFYHFKPFEYAYDMLLSDSIKMFNLKSQTENDFTELIEYYNRYNYFFDKNKVSEKEVMSVEDVHVFCFTKHYRKREFWNLYANQGTGVCIAFEFKKFDLNSFKKAQFKKYANNQIPQRAFSYEVRDVFYDSGYELDIVNEIRHKIFKEFGRDVLVSPSIATWFPYHYKRKKYQWEEEIRLSLKVNDFYFKIWTDLNLKEIDEIKIFETCKLSPDKVFLKIPFKNKIFHLAPKLVILGQNITLDNEVKITALCKSKKIRCWKYSNI